MNETTERREEVIRLINNLFREKPDMDYDQLMQEYRSEIVYAKRYVDHPDISGRLNHILLQSLKKSALQFYEEHGDIREETVKTSHSRYVNALKKVYFKNSDEPWKRFVKEILRLEYPDDELSLDGLLNKIEHIGPSLKEGNVEEEYPEIVRLSKDHFSHHGKAIILTGIDYLENKDEEITLEYSDVAHIFETENLSFDKKVASLFNALSLQHYDTDDVDVISLTDQRPEWISADNIVQFEEFHSRIGIYLFQHSDRLPYAFSLSLSPEIKNPFHYQTFELNGKNAGEVAFSQYSTAEKFLKYAMDITERK